MYAQKLIKLTLSVLCVSDNIRFRNQLKTFGHEYHTTAVLFSCDQPLCILYIKYTLNATIAASFADKLCDCCHAAESPELCAKCVHARVIRRTNLPLKESRRQNRTAALFICPTTLIESPPRPPPLSSRRSK